MYPDAASREHYKKHEGSRIQFQEHLETFYGGIWNYNEVIGYIRLHFLGGQIRGEYFGVKAKKIYRSRHKTFQYETHKLAPEISITREASNLDIFAAIHQYVTDCQKELKGRFLDTEVLLTIGPHMNWRALLDAYWRGEH